MLSFASLNSLLMGTHELFKDDKTLKFGPKFPSFSSALMGLLDLFVYLICCLYEGRKVGVDHVLGILPQIHFYHS